MVWLRSLLALSFSGRNRAIAVSEGGAMGQPAAGIHEENVSADVLDSIPDRVRHLVGGGADTIMVAIRPMWKNDGSYNIGVIWHMPDANGGSVEEEWEQWRPREYK